MHYHLAFINFLFLISCLFSNFSVRAFTVVDTLDNVKLWDESSFPLTFDYNLSNCPVSKDILLPEIEKGLNAWNKVPGTRIKLQLGKEVSMTLEQLDAASNEEVINPLIECRVDFVNLYLNGDTEARTVGMGGYKSYGYVGQLLNVRKGFIMLNADPSSVVGSSYMQNNISKIAFVITHEAGHVIGLAHSADENSCMNYAQDTEDGLGFDDYFAIRYLYPSKATSDDLIGCGSLGFSKSGINYVLFLLLILPLMLSVYCNRSFLSIL